MIKVDNIETWGFEHAIRGMRNPMNSWNKMDSYSYTPTLGVYSGEEQYQIGENDLTLMKKLFKAGTEHRKYTRQIFVSMDITAPLYWWSEYDTYKVGTVANSCSKMHKLLAKPFEMNDFSFDKLSGYKNEIKQFKPLIDEEMVANEIWVNWDNEYAVSNYGRVKHEFKNHYRIISGSLHQDGYIFATIKGKQLPVHRMVQICFSGADEKDLEVNHIDGNKQNNFANNLEWCTRSENMLHAHKMNLQPINCNTYKGKFTQEEREEIKKLWDSGKMSKREIAKKHNVSHTCINDILADKYKYANKVNLFEELAKPLIDVLNELRDSYLTCDDKSAKKQIWYSIIQLIPSSYNQRRTVTMTYENVFAMIQQRKDHKLDEWREFVKVLQGLPYVEEIMNV